MERQGPAIYVETDGRSSVEVVLVDAGGGARRLEEISPADDLLAALEADYSELRREIRWLWEEHPLFEERLDIPVADLEDLTAEVLLLPDMIRERDPLACFVMVARLDAALRMEDDGSALFLLNAGARLLHILEEPIRTQNRLRNIFEVTFDGMAEATQHERYERLRSVYPFTVEHRYPMRWVETSDGRLPFSDARMEYVVGSLYELRLLELMLYFRQEQRRIVRCECCWNYFIPRTTRTTIYCDRVVHSGRTCKQVGPLWKRSAGPEQDEALRRYADLRHRMAARAERYQDAEPGKRQRLIQMDSLRYGEWSDLASAARMRYLRKEICAEEFLRTVDVFHEFGSYETAPPQESGKSKWQEAVERDIDLDPAMRYQTMQVLDLRRPENLENAEWQTLPPEELARMDREGHQSLLEKYGEGKE